jgi:hypothetical protein
VRWHRILNAGGSTTTHEIAPDNEPPERSTVVTEMSAPAQSRKMNVYAPARNAKTTSTRVRLNSVHQAAPKYIENSDLVAGLVEGGGGTGNETQFNSPAWLKHIQKANAAMGGLTPEKMAHLRVGEAFVWSSKATGEAFIKGAAKVKLRARVAQPASASLGATP